MYGKLIKGGKNIFTQRSREHREKLTEVIENNHWLFSAFPFSLRDIY
jgi:hypothetical protein